MYSYEWDKETGGYILQSTELKFSKEPRPVYYKELDILGFDKYWEYDKNDKYPYMWAESNSYYYRGELVARTKGGSLYTKPELDIVNENPDINGKLQFVNIPKMVEKNKAIMETLVNATVKRVYNTYIAYKNKMDVFYVAFSGGKDSVALLDIIQRALPHNSFKVIFGDTKMENPDTYDLVNKVDSMCQDYGIEFLRATSHLNTNASWLAFGYPSQKLRWCCAVHKTTPQINLLRKVLNKRDFKGMAFVGVRRDESLMRSKYETISEGEKHEGQFNFNAIDDWNSAELFLYIYENNLFLNESYKKGNSRVGCLMCPMSSGKHEYMKRACYQKEVDYFVDLIKRSSNRKFEEEQKERQFIENGGWKIRNNGRDLKVPDIKYEEKTEDDKLFIYVIKNTKWSIWLKTLGEFYSDDGINYKMIFMPQKQQTAEYLFSVEEESNKLKFTLNAKSKTRTDIKFLSLFKSCLKKSAYCLGCRECEANCINGCISMSNGLVIENCQHCFKCHNIDSGCLVYNSIKILKGVEKKMSLDCYLSFGVEKEWVERYLKYKEDFWKSEYNDLGSMKITALKRFLRDAKLKLETDKTDPTSLKMNEIYDKHILNTFDYWSIILVNLAYSPQINWFLKNTVINERYLVDELKDKISDGSSVGTISNIISSLKNLIMKTPLGQEINIASCEMSGNKLESITRLKSRGINPIVVLYSLYRFAEACGDYYQFTLTRLFNYSIDSDGVSPARIFGVDKEELQKILMGLSINYPDFINTTFTLDLDNINLRKNKTSFDVLNLI